jgi:PII-like signaling protein
MSARRRWIPGQTRKDGKCTWQEKTMLKNGPAKKLTIYVDETEKVHGKPVYEAVLEILISRKISGASVYRGVAGYGSHGKLHTAKILELSTTLPVKIEVVDTEGMINIVLAEISSVVEKGLIEVSDTNVIKCSAGKT